MKSPGNMLRYCRLRISAISNRSEDASKGTVPLSTLQQDNRLDREMEEEIIFEEIDTPEAEEKGGRKKRRQFFQRLRQIAAPKKLAGASEFEEDENTYTEDDTISVVEEEDENHFVTSFDRVGMNDSAVAITVFTEMDSVQKNQDKIVDYQMKKRGCFRAEDIWAACKVGDEDFVNNTIANDPALVHLAENGRTPLYNACLCGHERIVKILLEAGAQDLDRTAYIAALSGPCQELLREYESNQKAQLQFQEEIAKRLVEDREKEETAAILKDLVDSQLGPHGTTFLDNDMDAVIECTSIDDDSVAEAEAEADHNNDTGDTDVDTPNDIGRCEAMDCDDDSDGGGAGCDVADSNDRGNADVEAAGKNKTSAAVDAVEESFYTQYNVFVPFQSHLVCTIDEGFETILEPAIKPGEEGNDMAASDLSFDPRVLDDAVQFIRVFTKQDDISAPIYSSPVSDGDISSKLDNLKAKHSSPRARTSSLLAKYAYDTDGTASLSTDGQTFASEGDFFLADYGYDTELTFKEVTEDIEFTFCPLLFPAAFT
jgi:hypothetical protein